MGKVLYLVDRPPVSNPVVIEKVAGRYVATFHFVGLVEKLTLNFAPESAAAFDAMTDGERTAYMLRLANAIERPNRALSLARTKMQFSAALELFVKSCKEVERSICRLLVAARY